MAEKQASNQSNSSDEIDLGQLFQMIGKGFNKFFQFLGNIFKGIFNSFILLLLFIQKHILKFIILAVVGLAVGIYLDITLPTKYTSSMVVEPNFNSVQQLYNNINYYDELAEAKDSIGLAEALGISVKDASFIKDFEIDSYSDENQKILLFDKFVRSLDSTTKKAINMGKYLDNFNSFDARFHNISVISYDKTIAKKIESSIIAYISRNEYFQLQQSISNENISIQDSMFRKQLMEVDSLQQLYKRVMVKEAEKPMQGTNINLGEGEGNQNRELALINQVDFLRENFVSLNIERANKSSIINIISAFPRRGVEINGVLDSYKFWVPIGSVGFLMIILIMLDINGYLKRVKKIAY
jgi:hypothetical protein